MPSSELLRRALSDHRDKLLLTTGSDAFTYGEVGHRLDRLRSFAPYDSSPDVVIALTQKPVNRLTATLLAASLDAPVLPLPAGVGRSTVDQLLSAFGAALVVTDVIGDRAISGLPLNWCPTGDLGEGLNAAVTGSATGRYRKYAYFIFTSGSTGGPKLVAMPKTAASKHFESVTSWLGLTARDVVLQFAQLSFDTAHEEIWPTVLAGARLHAAPTHLLTFGHLLNHLAQGRVSVLQLPTAYWREMIHAQSVRQADPAILPSLRTVVIGGEAAFWEDVHLHREGGLRDATLINSYGPTEAGITSTAFTVGPGGPPSGALPLGTPLGDREILLTAAAGDANLQQLVIKGPEVADGYFRLDDLSLVSFPGTGDRVFDTGDLVTVDAVGQMTFAGRQDRQVKVRGSRISLDAVEAALLELGATAAAAFVTPNRHGNLRIEVAVSGLSPDRPLKQELAALGPAAPVRYHHLSQLPKRSSGKVDHRAVAELCRTPSADEVPTL